MSVAFLAVRREETRNSTVVRRWGIGKTAKPRTRSPDVLSANGIILTAEAETVEVEIGVEGETGRGEDGRMRESEEEKREEGGEPGHC